jgi:hypothetical protein
LGTLLQAIGRAELDALGKTIEAILFIPACVLAVTTWGLSGACWTGAGIYLLSVVLRTISVGVVLRGQRAAVTADWLRCALPACVFAYAGLIAESHGNSPLWVAPMALALYVVVVLQIQPHLLRAVAALVSVRFMKG